VLAFDKEGKLMRALVCHGIRDFRVDNRPVPTIGEG
jgi:hypothetical protein